MQVVYRTLSQLTFPIHRILHVDCSCLVVSLHVVHRDEECSPMYHLDPVDTEHHILVFSALSNDELRSRWIADPSDKQHAHIDLDACVALHGQQEAKRVVVARLFLAGAVSGGTRYMPNGAAAELVQEEARLASLAEHSLVTRVASGPDTRAGHWQLTKGAVHSSRSSVFVSSCISLFVTCRSGLARQAFLRVVVLLRRTGLGVQFHA